MIKKVVNHGSTLFLRLAVIAFGIVIGFLTVMALPGVYRSWALEYPGLEHLRYPVMLAICATVVPCYIALFQVLKLLNYIDTNRAFSKLSVRALRNVMYCGVTIGCLYVVSMPLFYWMAQAEDAPGLIIMGMMAGGAAFVIATLAAVLRKLLQSAIDIKSENDLTV